MTENSDHSALILLISHTQAARQQQKDGGIRAVCLAGAARDDGLIENLDTFSDSSQSVNKAATLSRLAPSRSRTHVSFSLGRLGWIPNKSSCGSFYSRVKIY